MALWQHERWVMGLTWFPGNGVIVNRWGFAMKETDVALRKLWRARCHLAERTDERGLMFDDGDRLAWLLLYETAAKILAVRACES